MTALPHWSSALQGKSSRRSEDAFVARSGWLLVLGAATLAAAFLLYPGEESVTAVRVGDIGGLAFQVGLLALWLAYRRTGALGNGRSARRLLWFVVAVLALASVWSILHLVLPSSYASAWWMVALDSCWPLSMLAFLVAGAVVAVTARWRRWLRWLPLVAGLWLPVSMGLMALLPARGSDVLAPVLLLVLHGGLGLVLARRPQLTRDSTPPDQGRSGGGQQPSSVMKDRR